MIITLKMIKLEAQSTVEHRLKSVSFSNKTLTLNWDDQEADKASLFDEGDCIYTGHLARDALSDVLVTGCEDTEVSVQVQSELVGDRIFSLKNGSIEYVTFEKDELYQDYIENEEFESQFGVVAEKNGRLKRNTEDDFEYDYYDEPEENPEFDEKFPDLDDNEIDDLPTPSKLILNINVYLDSAWDHSDRVVKQILRHAQKLFDHSSLNTRIDLQHGDRIYQSSAPHIYANKRGLTTFNSNLKGPYKIDGKYAVAHLHLTADIPPKKFPALGKATIASICDENPKAIVKYTKTELRTAMTVAHELGHVLGMEHDFKKVVGKRDKCQDDRRAGGTVMNYGAERRVWSECSNKDFKKTYSRIFIQEEKFCLKDPGSLECKCNGKTDLAGGECRTETEGRKWCFVDEQSACGDKKRYFSDFISFSACTGCRPDQWQCKADKKCIKLVQRCDFIRRHCSDGSDEADCPFPVFRK